jgi:hypothetical protein
MSLSLVVVVALGCAGGPRSTIGDGFLRVQGTAIVDGDGHPIFLEGISLGNEVWSNAALPDDHGEVDFRRLAAMGANSSRFLLNYRTFEDDSAPGVYRGTTRPTAGPASPPSPITSTTRTHSRCTTGPGPSIRPARTSR